MGGAKKAVKKAVSVVDPATDIISKGAKGVKNSVMPKVKMPKAPSVSPTASALSDEDDNVRSVAEAERKRLYGGQGRQGTDLLDMGYSNKKDKSDLLGG